MKIYRLSTKKYTAPTWLQSKKKMRKTLLKCGIHCFMKKNIVMTSPLQSFGEKVNTLKIHFCNCIHLSVAIIHRYSRIGVNFYRCTSSFHESLLHDLDTMQARRSRPRLTFSLVPPADFAFEIFFFPPVSSHLLILLLRLVIQPAGWFGLFFYWALISL